MYSQKQYDDEKKDADKYNMKEKLKPLQWIQPLKKNQKTDIFIWGKAVPRNMFPQNADQVTPCNIDSLSTKQIWNICAAKQGSHCLGIGRNDWCFVWGETKQIGALGLGNNCRSTSPFIIKSLIKQNIKEISCSAVHSLCITDKQLIYGWGSKLLTLLNYDAISPKPLNYLNGRNLTNITASNTHSLAYNPESIKIYSFGITGPWLGLNDNDNNNKKDRFGMIQFDDLLNDKEFSIIFADCSSEYTLLILNTGYIGSCGINEYGRCGIGKQIHSSSKIIWNKHIKNIISCSAGPFHAGFIDINGNVYTCGIGIDYRLGHGDQNIVWTPKMVKYINNKQIKISQIECVESRTFVITYNGDLIIWGKEPVNGRTHKLPFLYQYLNGYTIYKIVATKDFSVAMGVKKKETDIIKTKPDINNEAVDSMKPNQMMSTTNMLIGNVLSGYHPKCVEQGNYVNDVFGNFVGLKQVKYDNNNNHNNNHNNNYKGTNYIPPVNAVYGVPPPPPPPMVSQYGQNLYSNNNNNNTDNVFSEMPKQNN